MEPISEESNSETSCTVDMNTFSDTNRSLALRSGFLSLQERLKEWHTRNRRHPEGREPSENRRGQRQATAEQFANLQEFFQSKSNWRKQLDQEAQIRAARRPKIPVMKLDKEDWNVKCWEERTSWRKKMDSGDGTDKQGENNRLQKPEIQVKVFNGRIDDVAMKLDKVRQGQPLDEQLYKLEMNRVYECRHDNSWTNQLKDELSNSLHNREVLKRRLIEKQAEVVPGGSARVEFKSVLGRPIRRLFDDDND